MGIAVSKSETTAVTTHDEAVVAAPYPPVFARQTRNHWARVFRSHPTAPVHCPPRARTHSSFEEEEEQLKQVYDMRTWEMYLRISEYRKNQNGCQGIHKDTHSHHNTGTVTANGENTQRTFTQHCCYEQDMMFDME